MSDPMAITRFSKFNDGQDVAGRKPTPLPAHTGAQVFAKQVSDRKTSRTTSARAKLDDAYMKGYKTALLDTLYAADAKQQADAYAAQPPMDPTMNMFDGMPPMGGAPMGGLPMAPTGVPLQPPGAPLVG